MNIIFQKLFHKNDDQKLLIFIHGITGCAHSTWLHNDFYFPEEMHNELNGYSSFVFDYDSNKFSSSIDFSSIINKLKIELQNIDIDKYNEIIFIAHSMGGLISKTFLLDSSIKHIALKTTRLILLATPNNGSFFPKIIQHLSKNVQFSNLTPIHDNVYLQQLTDMWINQYGNSGSALNSIQCYCGYEKLKTFLKTIVPLGDTSSPCCDMIQGFEKNHITISKPIDKNDEIYIWVKNRIKTTLTEFEKLSKKALYTLYNSKILILEQKISDIESDLLNFFNKDNKNESIIENYYSLINEKEVYLNAFTDIENLLLENKTLLNNEKLEVLLKKIDNNDLAGALEVFSDKEIDLEIKRHEHNKQELVKKIKLKIELSILLNKRAKIEEYFSKLLVVDNSSENFLSQANYLKSINKIDLAYNNYKQIINNTSDNQLKAISLNNLATLSMDLHIPLSTGITYIKDAIKIYENLFNASSNESNLTSLIESKLNLMVFEFTLFNDMQKVEKEYIGLIKQVNLLDESSEEYIRLKFNIVNNYFAFKVTTEDAVVHKTSIENIIYENDKLLNQIIENDLHITKTYSENIAKYYSNKAAFYGTLFKTNLQDTRLASLSFTNLEIALKYRENILYQNNNNKDVIELKRSMGINYADRGLNNDAKSILSECLFSIDSSIHSKQYKELKVNILIDLITINKDCDENISKCNECISILDELNLINMGSYDLTYARVYMIQYLNMNICQSNKDKMEAIYLLAENKVKTIYTEEAFHLIKSLKQIKGMFNSNK